MKLVTEKVTFGWLGRDDNWEPGLPLGHGKTEFDAIVEFVRELLLRNDDAQEMLVNCVPGARLEDESLIHSHTCQQCGHIICFDCDCDQPVRNLWCSARCKAAFDL